MSVWKRNRLRVLRAERRLTQHVVAGRLGVSQATYWKWETGLEEPDPKVLQRLARVFGVKLPDLLEKSA